MAGQPIPNRQSIHRFLARIDIIKMFQQYADENIVDDPTAPPYNPYIVDQIQNYNPIYSRLFDLDESTYNNITLNHKYYIKDLETVVDFDTTQKISKPAFIKFSPLLDPIRYMIGKYSSQTDHILLPKPTTSPDIEPIDKLVDPNNAAYTDTFFCFLSSQLLNTHGFIHGVDFYGTFLGIQSKYKMEVTDDLEYLNTSTFYNNNINKLFSLENADDSGCSPFSNYGSRNHKSKLEIGDETAIVTDIFDSHLSVVDLENDDEADGIVHDVSEELGSALIDVEELEQIYQIDANTAIMQSDTSSVVSDSSCGSSMNYSDDDDAENDTEEGDSNAQIADQQNQSDWETVTDDSADTRDSKEQFILINDMPVQMICLERCEGTLDSLFEENTITCEEGVACLFQVIMILIAYKQAFDLTHNDLHTNNIMYVHTDRPFLYYRWNKQIYKVPTFGKIYKIIDFGRAIYKFRGNLFCSDSFADGGDAATQYNFEPYYNDKKSRVDPNYSFDLTRLGCSIYDFILDEDDDRFTEDLDDLQKIIMRWCTDDNDKNVLYKKSGEERYHNFKLYKMIARTVHRHDAESQLEYPEFRKFWLAHFNKRDKREIAENIIDIDAIPCYTAAEGRT